MNILITGASGYIGSQLINVLQTKMKEANQSVKIIATDIRDEPIFEINNYTKYIKMDVRSKDIGKLIKKENINTIVHLATIVTPGKNSDRDFEYSVDVEGTENILKACVESCVKRVIITSSGAAYGYHADNPTWLKESDEIRGNQEFAYSYHKRLVEVMMQKYRTEHPELEQVIFRIGTILGSNVNNQITSLFEKSFLLGISGSESPFVFIWDQDVISCIVQGIFGDQTGIYNVAGDGALTIDDIGDILNKKVIRIPALIMKSALFILKRLHLTQYGEEQVNFLRYRPVLDNNKLKSEFKFNPAYTSKEVFEKYIKGAST